MVNFIKSTKELNAELQEQKFAITIGDELPTCKLSWRDIRGIHCQKRRIGVGDKMAGGHGNGSIVSRVVRQEDMPFLAGSGTR